MAIAIVVTMIEEQDEEVRMYYYYYTTTTILLLYYYYYYIERVCSINRFNCLRVGILYLLIPLDMYQPLRKAYSCRCPSSITCPVFPVSSSL